jgi:nitrite reductase/ring-hydroxylating ferredoxin subunit
LDAPLSWYPIALSADLRDRPLPVFLLGNDYLLYRAATGTPACVQRYCPHMGADLALARITPSGLRCKLHGWEYGADGMRKPVPDAPNAPAACLRRLALHESGGVIYAWPGAAPAWDFPALPGLRNVRASTPSVTQFPCPMHAIGLNGFDIWHYGNVHGRHVRNMHPAPVVGGDAPHHLTLEFKADVRPRTIYDHVLVKFGYPTLHVKLDYHGGNLIAVRNVSGGYLALLSMAPLSDTRCVVYLNAFGEARDGVLARAAQAVFLALTRRIALYFLRSDEPFLAGMRPAEGLLVEGKDDAARAFWRWWNALPRVERKA